MKTFMNCKLITVLSLSLLISCQTKSKPVAKTQQRAETDTVQTDTTLLFNIDTAGYLLQLPMGNPDMLKRWKNVDKTNDIYRPYIYPFAANFCDSFLCGKTVKYDSSLFKEEYNEELPMSLYNVKPNVSISKKILQKDNYLIYLACSEVSKYTVKVFLLTVKDNLVIDSKTIYSNYFGESGYTYSRVFHIDGEYKLSIRKYESSEDGLFQSPLTQYILDSSGHFVQYYAKDGIYKTKEEQGLIKNHLREGKWIEKKSNMMLYANYYALYEKNEYTYLESEYKAGVPVGEWRFYWLDYEPKQGYLSGKKGELVYTEIYEGGKLKERIFEKEILDANTE